MHGNPHVILIDDDHSVLTMVGEMLTSHGIQVHPFSDGRRALETLDKGEGPAIDLVISDINMEGMDGFDVIHRVKAIQAQLPVVLMTGAATLDYAIRAMRMGAANLFQKPLSMRELVNSVFHLVELHRDLRMAESTLKGLVQESRQFCYTSQELDIPSLVVQLTDRLVQQGFAQPTNVDVYAMAYHEALVNAHEHGNLELDSGLKGDLFSEEDAYAKLMAIRIRQPEYTSRKVEVFSDLQPDTYTVTIRDEGKGFDTARGFTFSEDNLAKLCGRGLAMIHVVMDEVTFNDRGNEIRMVLRRKA